MKKLFITTLFLIISTVMMYAGVSIGDMKMANGVTYTKSNCKWIKGGSIRFEDNSYAPHLYLENLIINTEGEYEKGIVVDTGIYHNIGFHLTGYNIIHSDVDALVLGANYNEIQGDGTLEVHSSLKSAVVLQEFGNNYINDLRLWDGVTFIAEGKKAIETKYASNSVRVSGTCKLRLKSTDGQSCAVEGVLYFYLAEDMSFISPSDIKYDRDKRYMVDSKGNKYTGEVTAGVYDYLDIGGEPVSSWNWDKLKPECLKSGSISYDHDSHVLTLKNTVFEWDKAGSTFNVLFYFLYNSKGRGNFTIRLVGDNYFNLNNTQTGIVSNDTLRIEGDGNLFIHSPEDSYRPMIYITPHNPMTLACKSVTMVSESTNYNNIAFLGSMSSATREDRKLIIENTRLDITSPKYTFFEVDSIICLNGIELLEPEGARFDYDNKKIMVGEETEIPHVLFDIGTYPVSVQGIPVTWKNRNDVLGDGTVKYVPDTNVLTLNNAHIVSGDEEMGIYSEQKEFIINLQGKNSIKASELAIGSVTTSKDLDDLGLLTITGPGSLDIESSQYGINVGYQHLLFYNCGDVSVKAPFGIIGALSTLSYVLGGTPSKTLECIGVGNTNLTVESEGEESYALIFYGLELDEETVEVVEPNPWTFKFPLVYDLSSGEEVAAKKVVIRKLKKIGDVNEDGDVNINDVVAIINTMAGTANWPNANVNGDSGVNINDVVAVINIMAGK